jgi:hypothetical protein
MDALAILYISTLVHRHYITKADSQICPHDFVHANLWLITSVISQHNAYCILPLLALQSFWKNKVSETCRKTAHSCLHPLYENIMCYSLLCGGCGMHQGIAGDDGLQTLISTVSPRNNCNFSIVSILRATTELSSFTASSTIRRFGAFFRSKIAVEKSFFAAGFL